jgi:molybdenum cofactor biosynthesis enzyme MoaA
MAIDRVRRMAVEPSPALHELKRRLVKALLLSKLDYSDDLFTVVKFFINLRWERGVTASRLAAEWRELLREDSSSRHMYELYLHFPYCKSRCSYCFTNSRVPRGPDPFETYLREVREEAAYFAPLFEGVTFNTFALGGGTPSLMTADQLRRFCSPVLDSFRLPKEALRSVELNPVDTDEAKLRALRELGFNRVSFGVQSMTPETLRRVNRRQSFAAVSAAIRGARGAGFDSVGADVIFGMVDEPLESFLESFRQVAEIRPTEISVCTLSLTDKYMKATRTTREDYLRYYEKNLMPAFEGVMRISRRMGYQTPEKADPESGEWTVVDPAGPAGGETYCREEGDLPASMLGLGRGSRSQIYARRVYERDWEPFAPDAPIFQAAPMSLKEEMASYILANLEHGALLKYAAFRRRFGTDIREAFSFELGILRAFGQIRCGADGFAYLPKGVPHRVFWATVFALDSLAGLPCAAGLFDGGLRARLEADLRGLGLLPGAARA